MPTLRHSTNNYGAPADTSSNFAISGVNGTCLAANANRVSFTVQNLATTVLWVKLGAGPYSGDSQSVLLKADTSLNAGAGGLLTDTNWRGDVSVTGSAPRYLAFELT